MKKPSIVFVLILLAVSLLAQAPQSFKYQAIARDTEGNEIANTKICLRVGILYEGKSEQCVYSEIHRVITNDFGLISIGIGSGETESGDFTELDWSKGNYFISLDIDETGGNDFRPIGISQLLSVPYALYAEKSGTSASLSTGASAGSPTGGNNSKLGSNWVTTGLNTYLLDLNSRVGIGTNSPLGILDIAGKYHFPDVDGTNGQVLQTDGSGKLSWAPKDNVGGINDLTDGVSIGKSVFLGEQSGVNDDGTDNKNVALGLYALKANTSGDRNTANGYAALYKNTTGNKNVANGYMALYKNTTGYRNTASGYAALHNNTTGNYNVGVGLGANYNNQAGSKNTIIGHMAGQGTALHSKSGNIFLGYQAGFNETGNNKLYITNSGVDKNNSLIWGDFDFHVLAFNANVGIGTTDPTARLEVDGTIKARSTIESGNSIVIDGVLDKITASSDTISFENETLITTGTISAGTSTPDPSAILDASSTTKGFLPPRMTTAERDAISEPATGLVIFNYTTKLLEVFDGTIWGTILGDFKCGSSQFMDTRDSNVYSTVQIGTQCWMAENLAYLPKVDHRDDGSEDTPGNYYYVYGYDPTGADESEEIANAKQTTNYNTYGVLYNWTAAMAGSASSNSVPSGVQGACPAGWHLPSDEEWKILEGEVDSQYGYPDPIWNGTTFRGTDAGGNLREANTTHWISPNTGATNSSGFTALPAGERTFTNSFLTLSWRTSLWTSTMNNGSFKGIRRMDYNDTRVYRDAFYKAQGYSVRCIMD